LTGYERDPTVDEVSRKEYLRKNRRRPVDEIVNELGEGRGMHLIFRGVAQESRLGLLTCTQESLLPATRSAGHSASRPTTALTCRSPLRRKHVPYTQQYYSPCSNVHALLRPLARHGSSSEGDSTFDLKYQPRTTRLYRSTAASCTIEMHLRLCDKCFWFMTERTAYCIRFLISKLKLPEQLFGQPDTTTVSPPLFL
jgi:hypothetical protein